MRVLVIVGAKKGGNTDDMTKSPVFTEAETIGKAIGMM